MSSLSLPPHGASGASLGGSLASERGAVNSREAPGGPAFVALLGALGEADPRTHPAAAPAGANGAPASPPAAQLSEEAPPVAAWRTASAVHSLGSGVLVALDKRFGAAAAADETEPAPAPPKAKTGDLADASAPPNGGWTSLLLNLTGAGAAPRLAVALGATAASVIAESRAGRRGPGPMNEAVLPSNAAGATPAIGLNAGPSPVAATVLRAVTYLGLDPTARAGSPEPIAAGATPGSGSGGAPAASMRGPHQIVAPLGAAGANGDASGMSDGKPSGQNSAGTSGGEHAPDKSASAPAAQSKSASSIADASSATGARPLASDPITANGLPVVQISGIVDFIADAAGAMDPRGGDAANPARAGDSPTAPGAGPVKELEVQLNPGKLGTLSIEMRLSGGNLKVTIKAENAETIKLVGNETGAISDKLKALNFSVESITVKPLDTPATTGAPGGAAQPGTPGHGEASQGQSGQSAGGSTREGRSFGGEGDQRQPPPDRRGTGEAGGDGDPGHRFV